MNKLIIYFAIVKHFVWGLFIIFTPFELKTATLTTIYSLFPIHQYAGIVLILGAILALLSTQLKNKPIILNIGLLGPLTFFVMFSGFNAINQIIQGQYADGVVRPWQFIFVDQIYSILLMIFLLITIFYPLRHIKLDE